MRSVARAQLTRASKIIRSRRATRDEKITWGVRGIQVPRSYTSRRHGTRDTGHGASRLSYKGKRASRHRLPRDSPWPFSPRRTTKPSTSDVCVRAHVFRSRPRRFHLSSKRESLVARRCSMSDRWLSSGVSRASFVSATWLGAVKACHQVILLGDEFRWTTFSFNFNDMVIENI